MKKVRFVVLVMLVAIACSALPSMAVNLERNPDKEVSLGQDHVKMSWFITDYGTKEDGTPFAVTRKYYTNETIKKETIELLMSKFSYDADKASSLYFTAYEYEYTKDGKQFAVTYLGHLDMLGNVIHQTVYDDSNEAAKKTFAAVDPNSVPGKAAALLMKKK